MHEGGFGDHYRVVASYRELGEAKGDIREIFFNFFLECARICLFAATPPPSTNVCAPVCSSARFVLSNQTSVTASSNSLAKVAISSEKVFVSHPCLAGHTALQS
jgi:hypothetical protein